MVTHAASSAYRTDVPVEIYDAIDLCAGPGGWDVAARRLGIRTLGFEIDEAALLTRDANGHPTVTVECEPSKAHPRGIRGLSMTEVDPRDYFPALPATLPTPTLPGLTQTALRNLSAGRGRGLIASPPCQGFSLAGKGQARADSERLLKELEGVRTLSDLEAVIADAHEWMSHEGTVLVLEPLRWALSTCPSWMAWEQVPAVLPIWEACAVILRRLGYDVVTGNVQAEQYGVPQTRKRAILLARAPWLTATLGPLAMPTPTHSKYHVRTPERLDQGVERWVSMADALVAAGLWTEEHPDEPAFTVTGGSADNEDGGVRHRWRMGDVANKNGAVRDLDQPAATVTSSADNGNFRFIEERVNNQSGTEYDVEQQVGTPASVLTTRDLVTFRGPNANRFNGSTKSRNGIRVTPEEAAVLQSFPATYAFRGTKTKVFQQIGNAIPPLLAEACLAAVLGLPFRFGPVSTGRTAERWLTAAGAGATRRIGNRARSSWHPGPTLTGKGTACWTGPDGERI